jgi:hypothetical protein
MSTKPPRPEQVLERILEALEVGLITARDDEIMDAAKDLGMNPAMKGSAAFAEIRILMSQWRARGERGGGPEEDAAEPEHNGTPVGRIILKRDLPQSR